MSDYPVERCAHLPAEGSGRRWAGWGWVYRCGSIALLTCKRPECRPADPAFQQAVEFVR